LESDDEGNESPSPVKKPNAAAARARSKPDKAVVRQTNTRVKEVEKITRGTRTRKGEVTTTRSSATLPPRSTRTTTVTNTNANKPTKPVKRGKRKPPTPSPPPSDGDDGGENDEEEEEVCVRGSPDLVEDPSDDPVTTDSEP
jgi:hypothetical protein